MPLGVYPGIRLAMDAEQTALKGRAARRAAACACAMVLAVGTLPVRAAWSRASSQGPQGQTLANGQAGEGASAGVLPADFAIGPEDVLSILVWREKDLSLDVAVRPDGYITLPLVNDVLAAGKTPAELRDHVQGLLKAFVREPNVTVIVREIKSRKVYITGRIIRPGAYPLLSPMRAMDLIALAGGLSPAADAAHVSVLRNDKGSRVSLPIDYAQLLRGLRVWQDVLLRPGDTIVVP